MSLKDFWNEYAEVPQINYVELQAGTYNAKVVECKKDKTKNGDDKIFWDLELDAIQHFGVHRKFSFTDESEENKKNLKRMLDDFKNLGLSCRTDKIGESMDIVKGKTIQFRIVEGNQGGLFTNFVKIVDKPVKSGQLVRDPIDDEIPF